MRRVSLAIVSLFLIVVLAISANAQIILTPVELNLGMISGSYAIQKVSVLNQNSLSADVVVSSDSWISVYPSQFQLGAGEGKQLICTFLVLSEENLERTGSIIFTNGEQKVVLPIKVIDPLAEQRKILQVQAEKKQAGLNKDAEIQRLKEQLVLKDEELAEKDVKITELTTVCEQAVASANDFQVQLAEKDVKITELTDKLKEKDTEIARLESLERENENQQEPTDGLLANLKDTNSTKTKSVTYDGVSEILKNSIKKGDAEVSLNNDKVIVKICKFFPQGSIYPNKVSDEVLTKLGKVLKHTITSEGSITVVAYTDSVDIGKNLLKNFSDNQKLSEARAGVVKKILSLRKGIEINERQVVIKGEGANNPVATNDTSAGRAKNRRIEIIITPGKEFFVASLEAP